MSDKVDKDEVRCRNCDTILAEGIFECPKCGLKRLKNLLQYQSYASDEIRDLIERYDSERKNDNRDAIKRLLEKADSWRHSQDIEKKKFLGVKNVLHLREDGDIEIRKVVDSEWVTETRDADPAKVYEYTKKAAALGSVSALTTVAVYNLSGYGCGTRRTLDALALLCRAAVNKKNKKAYRILVQGDECFSDNDMYDLRRDNRNFFENSLTDVSFWEKRPHAVRELEKMIESNMLWPKYVLGMMYLSGNSLVSKDFDRGVKLLYSSAEEGPYHVQRAIQAKALLQFDKLVELKQNNVDAALLTHWKIENPYIRRETQEKMLMRTTLVEQKESGEIKFATDSRGSKLVRQAVARFKEANNASWITLPIGEKECKKISKRLFGYDWKYNGIHDSLKKDGKTLYYRAPFLGKNGFFRSNGLVFHCRLGLTGNLHSKEYPSWNFEYNDEYNIFWAGCELPKEKVDVLWLFRQVKCLKKNGRFYIDWDLGGPVDFKPAGFTEANLLTLLDYVRRCVLSDLRKGAKLIDGSSQKAQFASKIELPMGASKYSSALLKNL